MNVVSRRSKEGQLWFGGSKVRRVSKVSFGEFPFPSEYMYIGTSHGRTCTSGVPLIATIGVVLTGYTAIPDSARVRMNWKLLRALHPLSLRRLAADVDE